MTNRAGLACNITLDFGRTGWYGGIVEELSSKVRALPMWSRFAKTVSWVWSTRLTEIP